MIINQPIIKNFMVHNISCLLILVSVEGYVKVRSVIKSGCSHIELPMGENLFCKDSCFLFFSSFSAYNNFLFVVQSRDPNSWFPQLFNLEE